MTLVPAEANKPGARAPSGIDVAGVAVERGELSISLGALGRQQQELLVVGARLDVAGLLDQPSDDLLSAGPVAIEERQQVHARAALEGLQVDGGPDHLAQGA